MFDFIGGPNAEGSPTAVCPMSITAIDTNSTSPTNGIACLVQHVPKKRAVFDKESSSLTVRARADLELREELVDIALGRTDPATHGRS